MKKIWLGLLALILLIIFCVWTKKDSIHVSAHNPKMIADSTQKPVKPIQKHYINYEIIQDGNSYTLNGNFTNVAQQQMLKKACTTSSIRLKQGHTSTNKTLIDKDAILLTNKILPHFIQHYSHGKIVYSNQALHIYGNVDSYEAQHEMQRLLGSTTIASQDNSTVIVKKPVEFHISKQGDALVLEGQFNDDAQSAPIRDTLPSTAKIHLSAGKNLIDNGAISATQSILPYFMKKYTQGRIDYTNETLTVTGVVASQADLNSMHTLLSHASIPIIDHTSIDKEALAKAKAEEEKRRAQAEMAKKVQEAKAQRLAQEAQKRRIEKAAADKKAQEAETRRAAQEEMAKKAQEAKAQRLAQEAQKRRIEKAAADKKAQVLKNKKAEAARAKRNIINLLKIQNIEFEVAKGSLTPRGKGTVDKLANILKQYPDIKIEIAGHTDSDGSAAFNQKLSQSRVDTVKKRLISQKIATNRLTAKGYGESQPLVPNTSDENKQRNRRVEINIQGE